MLVCVWRSVPPPPHVGVGVKVELRFERFGSKSFPCWIMSPHVIFPSKNRAQVQGTIKRTYFLSSHGPPCFRSTSASLVGHLLPFFFLNCNISYLTVTKFLIAFISLLVGNCAIVTKNSGFSLLYSSQVGCDCGQLVFMLRSRLPDFLPISQN